MSANSKKIPITISLTAFQITVLDQDADRIGVRMPEFLRTLVDRHILETRGHLFAIGITASSASATVTASRG